MYNLREGDYMEKSEYLEIDAKTFIESITDNVRLRNVLAGNNALYAGIPDKTPIYVHALILNSYIESSYRFIDGGSQLAKQLRKQITNNGGVIYNRKEVTKLHIENKLINYAETETGERFEADHFISNAHPAQTLNLVDSDVIRPAYRKRIHSLENSISFSCLISISNPENSGLKNQIITVMYSRMPGAPWNIPMKPGPWVMQCSFPPIDIQANMPMV